MKLKPHCLFNIVAMQNTDINHMTVLSTNTVADQIICYLLISASVLFVRGNWSAIRNAGEAKIN